MSAQKAKMDQIASEIVEQGTVQPHVANDNLQPTTVATERTVRHDNPNLDSSNQSTENIPLPIEREKEDEFDL